MKTLRASKIGFPCVRNLWYSCNGYEGVTSEHSQRIFDVGTALEAVAVNWLRQDGWDVDYNPGSQSALLELVVPLKGGELRGHPDCFISKGEKQNILVDIKTMNDHAFRLWKQQGTKAKYPQYCDQLHVYSMGVLKAGLKVEGLGVVGINKNNSEMHIDFFDIDTTVYYDIHSRAENVFAMDTPPVDNCPSQDWACGYCEYSGLCELCKKNYSSDVGTETAATDDAEIIDAIQLLHEARSMYSEARELEADAKQILDAKVRQAGLKSITGGGFTLTLKETISNRFDNAAFKKAHPELVSDFTKQVKSVTYELKERR